MARRWASWRRRDGGVDGEGDMEVPAGSLGVAAGGGEQGEYDEGAGAGAAAEEEGFDGGAFGEGRGALVPAGDDLDAEPGRGEAGLVMGMPWCTAQKGDCCMMSLKVALKHLYGIRLQMEVCMQVRPGSFLRYCSVPPKSRHSCARDSGRSSAQESEASDADSSRRESGVARASYRAPLCAVLEHGEDAALCGPLE